MKTYKILTAIIFTAALFINSYSQWNSNPAANTILCTAAGNQLAPVAVNDGNGDVVCAWIDTRNSFNKIYVQKYNSTGISQWQTNGVELSSSQAGASDLMIIADGFGGTIICWKEQRSGSPAMYFARKINSSGIPQWASDVSATTAFTASNEDDLGVVCSDSFGGIIICYRRWNNSISRYEIHAQNITSNGNRYWGAGGVVVATTNISIDFENPQACPDQTGGALITYTRSGRVYAQRLNTNGVKQWGVDGFDIFGLTFGPKGYAKMCVDGIGGAFVAVMDSRNMGTNNFDVYAQRISSTGTLPWGDGGKPIAVVPQSQNYLSICYDKNAGAYIAWNDQRAGTGDSSHPYIQKINRSGGLYYALNGMKIYSQTSGLMGITVSDSSSAFAVIAVSSNYPNYTILAQRVSDGGALMWGLDAVSVCNVQSVKTCSTNSITTDNTGGLICVWDDNRNNPAIKSYGHKIQASGLTGVSLTSEIPSKFELGQNYPNPFNPMTNISFSIPKQGIVKLAVYDISGKEVAVLVNEYKPAGNYEITINASHLSSGVYFYSISTGDFSETKKMILVK